ncbi:MAG: Phage protein [uncultured Thermomicrobiales bacterium]|uniref:Phage protein n=1 Tax=uncultured Thermomicrobiales bacterium TaxID=1645740 RepID=A0A6J4VGR6_9BACT|nr:MAG: Phage protein [uncultured Thermomicrobiales bacterium]
MAESTTVVKTTDRSFEPARHLTRINGAEYLEVKWRLVWLRESHPDAVIATELHHVDERQAIFKATVTIPGGGSATGWGSESPGDFRDFLEKAETKALGRALAALGFGTQFCPDFDFGSDQQRVVDSPVKPFASRGRQQPVDFNGGRPNVASQPGEDGNTPTARQLAYLRNIAREAGLDDKQLDEVISSRVGRTFDTLDRRTVSQVIDHIKELPGNVTNIAS